MEEWKDYIDSWGFKHGPDLLAAAKYGDIAQAREAIKRGAPPYSEALSMASMKGYIDIVNLLIENGVNVNAKGNNGWTALMHASSGGYLAIVEILIKNGADINAKNNLGKTAAIYASEKRQKDMRGF
jgi:ankyrin repeat protein